MRQIPLTLLLTLNYFVTSAQVDSLRFPTILDEEYAVYQYDSILLMNILTYQYSDFWDMDNDGLKDSVEFISNGGAHAYYHLRIWLSSKSKWTEFPTFYIDFPHPHEIESLDELNGSYPQFVVRDFDNDEVDELYLNLDNPFASIPQDLIEQGVTSKQILIDYNNRELIVLNFKKQ